jgi:hypothetical protein
MRERASAIGVVLPVFLGLLLLPAFALASPSVVNVTATLNYLGGPPGNQTFRFDYTVENVDIEPAAAGFIVFFDADNVDCADFVSYAAPAGWEEVSVFPETPPDAYWNVEWDELYGTNRILPGTSLGGFSVTFTWKDANALPGSQFFEAWNGEAHEGYTTVVPGSSLQGSIQGTVVTVCGCNTKPADGVTVDLFTMNNVMLACAPTDVNGHYSFAGLAIGDYKITIVTPAGFVADEETKTASVSMGQPTVVDFQLSCLPIKPDARSQGYWKHQVNSFLCHKCGKCGRDKNRDSFVDYLCAKCARCGKCGKGEAHETYDNYLCRECSRYERCGKGKAHETLDDMLYYIDEIAVHFNQNLLNPVKMIEIDPEADPLMALNELLTLDRDDTMLDRAKMQAVTLLLNVVSLKLSQAQVISANGANVSQAITYVNQLIMDKVKSNDERAKDIAEYINNGRMVPSGWIPVSTPIIYYERDRHGAIVYLGKSCPNPFSSTASIAFALNGNGLVPVELKVFDVTGRVVKTLISDALEPGQHSVGWNGTSDEGAKVSSGVYFYELKTPTSVATGKLVYRR